MTEVIEDEEDNGGIVTERVHYLAQGIYDEFQSMVGTFGPESIEKMMPLVVNVLENLDSALADNQTHLTALMEVNEENQALSKQYQREKERRKEIEEKAMRSEDVNEQELRELRNLFSEVQMDNKTTSAKLKAEKEKVEKLSIDHEIVKRDYRELHDRNIEMIKKFHGQMEHLKETTALKLKEVIESPRDRVHGFQDFISPPKGGKKKRNLPLAPRQRRGRAASQDEDDVMFLATTPALKADDIMFPSTLEGRVRSPSNELSLHAEQQHRGNADLEEGEGGRGGEGEEDWEEDPYLRQLGEEFDPNESSLLAELHMATSDSVPGVEQIILENQQLNTDKNELTREANELLTQLQEAENDKEVALSKVERISAEAAILEHKSHDLEAEVKRLREELETERERAMEGSDKTVGPDGCKLTRLEVARVLRERNEYKEKYLSLLEQIRMNDELSLFKTKKKSSRWVDFFAAVFSPAKRRQLEKHFADSSPRRPILSRRSPADGLDEEDRPFPQRGQVGYRNTDIIPVLRKTGKQQDEVYMTSVSWVIPSLESHQGGSPSAQPATPSINTCRPMSFQEDGAKILCAAAVNPATFLEDHAGAVAVRKDPSPLPEGVEPPHPGTRTVNEASMSVVWIVTGLPSLTKVSILDAAAVGEVVDTFPVCASPVQCIAAVPAFNDQDPDDLLSFSTARKKTLTPEVVSALKDRPSSRQPTMWMGCDTGVLYVHSAVSYWKKCMHADKLPSPIQSIVFLKGKVFILLQNGNVAVFRRYQDGEWDWDNYSMIVLSQRKDLPLSTMAAVKFNVWCALGNTVHVVHSHLLKVEATFTVSQHRQAVVSQLEPVGDGVWMSFTFDSTLRLYHSTTFTHMQDIDIAPRVHKVLVFGSEKRSTHMPIQISSLVAAHNSLWVGTENGILLALPFTAPAMVAEETGWEVIKEAEVAGRDVPEPFDVRTEFGVEVGGMEGSGSSKSSNVSGSAPQHALSPPHREAASEARSSSPRLEVTDANGTARASDHGSIRSSPLRESPLPRSRSPTLTVSTDSLLTPSHSQHLASDETQHFNPFCSVDQIQVSIHCHINAVRCLVCVPGLVQQDLAVYEPLGGVYIGGGEGSQQKPALFVLSCGEGHLDLRTADKVLQTLHAKETGHSGLPSPATIISEKNYIMVWDINS